MVRNHLGFLFVSKTTFKKGGDLFSGFTLSRAGTRSHQDVRSFKLFFFIAALFLSIDLVGTHCIV